MRSLPIKIKKPSAKGHEARVLLEAHGFGAPGVSDKVQTHSAPTEPSVSTAGIQTVQRGCQTSCLNELSSFLGSLVGDNVFKLWL